MCEAIGGTLYANDVICCPKKDASATDVVPYPNECNRKGDTRMAMPPIGGLITEVSLSRQK
ncbi:hypothetical protein PG996_014547 [Apiospora saccharicola]|uniref:Uncharacterized protein n=1 Tax=Apiospora saccharicola TaxID=335842 RepID=A0ABR1TIM1_9PEZI